MAEAAARKALVEAYHKVCDLGLTDLSSGNVSVRYKDGMLVSATGATRENIREDNLVYMSLDGQWAPEQKPSSEWQLHTRVYRENLNTNAVVHTHSDYCVAVACHCRALPPFHYMVGVFGGHDVPCTPYSTFGSEKLAEDVAEALKTRSACLMGNHGATARGGDLAQAVMFAHRLEISCRHYILSQALGEPRLLTPEEMDAFHKRIGLRAYGA